MPLEAFQLGDRVCTTCGHVGPIEDYTRDDRYRFGRKNECRRCASDAAALRIDRIRDEYRVIIDRYKNQPCVDCGDRHPPYVMDLDHVRGDKDELEEEARAAHPSRDRPANREVRSFERGHVYRKARVAA